MECAYLEEHTSWPRSGKVVPIEVLVHQRVLCGNLQASQVAHATRGPVHVTLEHGTDHLGHDLRCQLNTKRTTNAIVSEVAISRLAIHIDRARVREHARLYFEMWLSVEWHAGKSEGLTSRLACARSTKTR